jgi:hypothetical protein
VDREFPPSDTQIFPLTLSEAGEFKVYCRFHEAQGDDGVAYGEWNSLQERKRAFRG